MLPSSYAFLRSQSFNHISFKATSVFMRGIHETGRMQWDKYQNKQRKPSFAVKTSSKSLIHHMQAQKSLSEK